MGIQAKEHFPSLFYFYTISMIEVIYNFPKKDDIEST